MKPSERFKRRYVAFSLLCEGKALSASEAKKIVHEHFLRFFGEIGIASLAFKLVKYEEKKGRGIIRCAKEKLDEAVFCCACLSEFEGKKCRMETLKASGTVKRASR
ncbi:MAG: Rpp14/Pop5 family protein [Candidatus Anstonellaceae archaeon]